MTLDEIVEEFLCRQRQGERPTAQEYADRFPDLADEILATLPALAIVEHYKHSAGEMSPELSVSAMPERIGDYQILGEIGRGGMGVVYEAEQQSLRRRVALKVLPQHASREHRSVARFQREARAAAKMHHTNIVPVFEVGKEGDYLFYAMQLIRGHSLDQLVEEIAALRGDTHRGSGAGDEKLPEFSRSELANDLLSGRLQGHLPPLTQQRRPDPTLVDSPESSMPDSAAAQTGKPATLRSDLLSVHAGRRPYHVYVAQIGMQVAEALAYAHARGIVHRDIKPSNLLLDGSGVTWVTDFGLARTDDEGFTRSGDVLGTLRYMAPERFQGECDERVDIYSLGLTLYEMLVLRPAFESADGLKLIEQVTHSTPTPPRALDSAIPRDLETIVLKSIEPDRNNRYSTAEAMAEDLARFIRDEPIAARRALALEHMYRWARRNRPLAAALSVVVILIMLVAVASPIAYFRESEFRVRAELAGAEAQMAEIVARRARRQSENQLYYAEMNLAGQAAFEPGGIAAARKWTLAWKPSAPGEVDRRGWEWYYLFALCHRERLSLTGHTRMIWSASWKPDGTQLVSSGNDGTFRIWDAASGECQSSIETRADRWVDWSPDGTRLAGATFEGLINILDLQSGKRTVLQGHKASTIVRCVQWHPDGKRLASCGNDGTINIWDTQTGEVLISFADSARVTSVCWNPDGTQLASAGTEYVKTWDIRGNLLRDFEPTGIYESVSWNHDGTRLAGSKSVSVVVWDVPSGEVVSMLSTPAAESGPVDFHPKTNLLAVAYQDRAVRIWDLVDEHPLQVLAGHTATPLCVCWSPDGEQLASVGMDQTVRLWQLNNADRTRKWFSERSVLSVDWSPDDAQLAFSGIESIYLRGLTDDEPLMRKIPGDSPLGERQVFCVRWSPDGTQVASAGHDHSVRVWDVQTGQQELIGEHDLRVWELAWSPDGKRLASAGGTDVRVWDIRRKQCLHELQHGPSRHWTVSWSPDGQRLATAADNVNVTIWDANNGKELRTFVAHQRAVRCVRWSPDGSLLATAAQDRTVGIWNGQTWARERSLEGHTGSVMTVAWRPAVDNKPRLAAGIDNGNISIWDWESGRATVILKGHTKTVNDVRWSADGTRLASASSDGSVQIWDATIGYRRNAPVGSARSETPSSPPE